MRRRRKSSKRIEAVGYDPGGGAIDLPVKWIFYSKPLPAPRNPLILLRRVRNLTLT